MHCCLDRNGGVGVGDRRLSMTKPAPAEVGGCIFVEIDMDKATLNKHGIHVSY